MRELAAKLASQNVVLEPELDLALDQALLAALLTHSPLLIAVQDRAGYYR